jgi:hypothetical protein
LPTWTPPRAPFTLMKNVRVTERKETQDGGIASFVCMPHFMLGISGILPKGENAAEEAEIALPAGLGAPLGGVDAGQRQYHKTYFSRLLHLSLSLSLSLSVSLSLPLSLATSPSLLSVSLLLPLKTPKGRGVVPRKERRTQGGAKRRQQVWELLSGLRMEKPQGSCYLPQPHR